MEIRNLQPQLLQAGEHEQRFTYEDEEQTILVASIRTDGIQVPLIVTPAGDHYLIIDGHRRRQAALTLGLSELPCEIRPADPKHNERAAFVTNFLRKDPTPIELAVAIAHHAQAGEDAEDEIAQALHRSRDWVKRQIAMMDWPDDVLQQIHAGKISVAAASNLAEIEDDQYRAYLLQNAVDNGATARTTAAWLQAYRASLPAPEALHAQPGPAGSPAPALIPQAPCICCGIPHRVDELSHVPLCATCIPHVRRLGSTP